MKKILFIISIIFCETLFTGSEFVVCKKTKTKKETAVRVKEDIVELLGSSLRQLGCNIQESVTVQNQIFDKIKVMLEDNQKTTAQLREFRDNLEKYLKKLEEQQADLQNFLLSCK